jgi:hypothetical protein
MGIYQAGYFTSYGAVFGTSTLARLLPLPNPLAQGIHDSTQAALNSPEKTHHTDKTEPSAGWKTQSIGAARRIDLRIF